MLFWLYASAQDGLVYISKTGSKYHKQQCSTLRKESIAIKLEEAKRLGYEPCAKCFPEAATLIPAKNYPYDIQGVVVKINDGDSVTMLLKKSQLKIRLNGIDAPEIGQAYWKKSREFLSNAITNKTITARVFGVDRYGRLLADILVNGRNINSELVANGLAWHYKAYSSNPELAKLEEEARKKRIGLWQDPRPIAPWDYRRR